MEAEKTYWPIEKLTNWDKNPRSIDQRSFERLKKQIELLGEYKPLIITGGGVVLGGNMRLRAYKDMGWKQVWVSIVEAETDKEKLEFALSDNDRAGNYDEQQLAELTLNSPDIDLSLFHVDLGDSVSLREMAARFGPEIVQDEPPPLSDGPKESVAGEIYQLGNHRLMCGDATDIAQVKKLIGDRKVAMVFTDPPYNVNYTGKTKEALKMDSDDQTEDEFQSFVNVLLINILEVCHGAIYICMSSSEWHVMQSTFKELGGHWSRVIIWVKNRMVLSRADYHTQFEPIALVNEPDRDEEGQPILYGWKDGERRVWNAGRKETDIWHIDRPTSNKEHPTMKPVALPAKAISNSSFPEMVVLDLFGGSGTTLIAAEQLNRVCCMMEIDRRYVDVIRKRYANFIGRGHEWQIATPKI